MVMMMKNNIISNCCYIYIYALVLSALDLIDPVNGAQLFYILFYIFVTICDTLLFREFNK